MLKTWSQRSTSSKVAFQLVVVLGLVAVGCGGSSKKKTADSGAGEAGGQVRLDAPRLDVRLTDALVVPTDAAVPGDGAPSQLDTKPLTDGVVIATDVPPVKLDVAPGTTDVPPVNLDVAPGTIDVPPVSTDVPADRPPTNVGDGGTPDTSGGGGGGGGAGGAAGGASGGAVAGASGGAVAGASGGAVAGASGGAVAGASGGAVAGASGGAVAGASGGAVAGASGGAVAGASGGAVAGAAGGAVAGAAGGAAGGTPQVAQVTVSPASHTFPAANCGDLPAPYTWTFTLTNSGTTAAQVATLSDIAPYSLGTTLAVGDMIFVGTPKFVTVTAPAIPAVSAVPGSYAKTLVITTNEATNSVHQVALNQSATGTILAMISPSNGGVFDTLSPGDFAETILTVTNAGSQPAHVTASASATTPPSSPSAFTVINAEPFLSTQTIPAASGTPPTPGQARFKVRFTAPLTPATYGASISLASAPTDHRCSDPLADLAVSGTSSTGSPLLSPHSSDGPLQFDAHCGDSLETMYGLMQTITITNIGNTSMTYSASITDATKYFDLTTQEGDPVATAQVSVPGMNGVSHLQITPNFTFPSPGVDHTNNLHIHITSTSSLTGPWDYFYILHTTPEGDVLTFSPSELSFMYTPLTNPPAAGTSLLLTITNNGLTHDLTQWKANVTLTITNNLADYSFCEPGYEYLPLHVANYCNPATPLVTAIPVEIPAKLHPTDTGSWATVPVYYVPSYQGHVPAISSPVADFTYSLGAEGSCMGEPPAMPDLVGSTIQGIPYSSCPDTHHFATPTPPDSCTLIDFGDVYCGDTAGGPDTPTTREFYILDVDNSETYPFTITSFTMRPYTESFSSMPYQLLDADGAVLLDGANGGSSISIPTGYVVGTGGPGVKFSIRALQIPQDLSHSDLYTAHRFDAVLSFTTNVKDDVADYGTHETTLATNPKGVIISATTPPVPWANWGAWATWGFAPISWPDAVLADDFRPLDNQGNVNALVTMSSTYPFYLIEAATPGIPVSSLTIAPGAGTLNTEYGSWPRYTMCNTQNQTDNNRPGTLTIQVDPPTRAGTGVCGAPPPAPGSHLVVVGDVGNEKQAWQQILTLTGTLVVSPTPPCHQGQRCQNDSGGPDFYNHCICDGTSCPNGCCGVTDEGTCVGYASEWTQLCGDSGAICGPCPDNGSTCQTGVCACPSDTAPYLCGGLCRPEGPEYCGGCVSCDTAHTNKTCQNHTCECPSPGDVMCANIGDAGPSVYACMPETAEHCGTSCQDCTQVIGVGAQCIDHACACPNAAQVLCSLADAGPGLTCTDQDDNHCGPSCQDCVDLIGGTCLNGACVCPSAGDVMCSGVCTVEADNACGPTCQHCQDAPPAGMGARAQCTNHDCVCTNPGDVLCGGACTAEGPGSCGPNCYDCATRVGGGAICTDAHTCACPVGQSPCAGVGDAGPGYTCRPMDKSHCGPGCVSCNGGLNACNVSTGTCLF